VKVFRKGSDGTFERVDLVGESPDLSDESLDNGGRVMPKILVGGGLDREPLAPSQEADPGGPEGLIQRLVNSLPCGFRIRHTHTVEDPDLYSQGIITRLRDEHTFGIPGR
jgi:hypothetical protein